MTSVLVKKEIWTKICTEERQYKETEEEGNHLQAKERGTLDISVICWGPRRTHNIHTTRSEAEYQSKIPVY